MFFFTNSMLLSPPCSSEFGFIRKVLQPVVKGGPSLWIYRVRMIHVGVPLDTFLYLHIIQYISKPTHLFPSLTVIYHNNIWLLLMIISPYCLELLFQPQFSCRDSSLTLVSFSFNILTSFYMNQDLQWWWWGFGVGVAGWRSGVKGCELGDELL